VETSLLTKLELLRARSEELSALMSDADVIADQNKFREYAKEYKQLTPVVDIFREHQTVQQALEQVQAMQQDSDPDMQAMAAEEMATLTPQLAEIEQRIQVLLLPQDPDDTKNIYLEVRAGTGGDEAAIFAGDLFRMYGRYAEAQGWHVEILSQSLGEHGGYKEIISLISGQEVYSRLKFESGAHRVQRVPETESQGRIHTSACTVAVMPEADAVDDIEINTADLRIDTFRASGAGGQHVNTTDSAIRITHLPSGIVVECQEERSQHKNKAKALSLLQAKILATEREKQQQQRAETRRNLVGSGDRSERIRTYNFPQGRVTDHRINLTLYKLNEIIEGDLNPVIEPLIREHQADQLAAVGE